MQPSSYPHSPADATPLTPQSLSKTPLTVFDPTAKRPDNATILAMHRYMVQVRLWDERALKLQRSGRIGFCVTGKGEEATQIGVAAALNATDWIFPAYRQHGIPMWRGVALEALANQLFGNAQDLTKGRQMPCHYSFAEAYFASYSSVIGSQIIHATGAAMAAQIKGDKQAVAVAYFGDGATSANDFHSALNLAAVRKAPALFCCVNNQWAISLPYDKQTASASIAEKASAYGMKGVRVDGNDALAVWQVTRQLIEGMHRGEGPALLELLTYRVNPHSSSDDDSRYRDEATTKAWEAFDPIERLEAYLRYEKLSTQEQIDAVYKDVEALVYEATNTAHQTPLPTWDTLFEDVYEVVPPSLAAQRDDLLRYETGLKLAHPGAFPL
jgi:pyruvate dehydrogenase E1 component alpha subunit